MEVTTEIPRTDEPTQGAQSKENKTRGLHFSQGPLTRKKEKLRNRKTDGTIESGLAGMAQ